MMLCGGLNTSLEGAPGSGGSRRSLEIRHCPSCGAVKRAYWTHADGTVVARYSCNPCTFAKRRAANRRRDPATLKASSLTKMGMGHLIPPKPYDHRPAEAAARASWREWLQDRAPAWWMARHFEAKRKPWNNPRLTSAEKYRLRYNLDQEFRASQLVRCRLKKKRRVDPVTEALRHAALGRRKSLHAVLGYTPGELRDHLARTLPRRASWSDFEERRLHIDHIVPTIEFDLSTDEGVRACFALSNLRLLWAKDNLAKGAKRTSLV
jgi:hypothetical protein